MEVLTSPAWDAKSNECFRDADRLSHSNTLESCKFIRVLFEQICKLVHACCTLCSSKLLPWAFEGSFGCNYGGIDIFRASDLDVLGDNLVCGWVYDGEGLAQLRFDKLAWSA